MAGRYDQHGRRGQDTTILTHGPWIEGAFDLTRWFADRVPRRSGNDDIFVMNADGSELAQSSEAHSTSRAPDWSPDGTMVVARGRFSRFRRRAGTPDPELWTVTVGSGVELTAHGRRVQRHRARVGARRSTDRLLPRRRPVHDRTDGSGAKPITRPRAAPGRPRGRRTAPASPSSKVTPAIESAPHRRGRELGTPPPGRADRGCRLRTHDVDRRLGRHRLRVSS